MSKPKARGAVPIRRSSPRPPGRSEPLSPDTLSRRRTYLKSSMSGPELHSIRLGLKLSQPVFATALGVSLATLIRYERPMTFVPVTLSLAARYIHEVQSLHTARPNPYQG